MVKATMARVRSNANKIAIGGREKIKELQQDDEELADKQLERASEVVEACKTAVKRA
jgi:hypothetical protein